MIEQDDAVAQHPDILHAVRNEKKRGALLAVAADSPEALVLEVGVANRQGFVDNQDIGADRGGDREGHSNLHAARISSNRLIEIFPDLCKRLDIRQQRTHGVGLDAHQAACVRGVFAPGELGIEADAELEDGRDATPDLELPLGCAQGPCNQFEQGALPGTVRPDDADRLTGRNSERNMAQCPVLRGRRHRHAQPRQHAPPLRAVGTKRLADIFYGQNRGSHNTSTISVLARRNSTNATANSDAAIAASQPRTTKSGGRS